MGGAIFDAFSKATQSNGKAKAFDINIHGVDFNLHVNFFMIL